MNKFCFYVKIQSQLYCTPEQSVKSGTLAHLNSSMPSRLHLESCQLFRLIGFSILVGCSAAYFAVVLILLVIIFTVKIQKLIQDLLVHSVFQPSQTCFIHSKLVNVSLFKMLQLNIRKVCIQHKSQVFYFMPQTT